MKHLFFRLFGAYFVWKEFWVFNCIHSMGQKAQADLSIISLKEYAFFGNNSMRKSYYFHIRILVSGRLSTAYFISKIDNKKLEFQSLSQ